MNQLTSAIRTAVKHYPPVVNLLTNKARYIAFAHNGERKTYDYFLTVLERLIRSVYSGLLGGEFIDILANLIEGQITQAYEQAWLDDGNLLPLPANLQDSAQRMILGQFDFVDQFFRDIVDAKVDGTSIEPLLVRAKMWANRFKEAYNDARLQIAAEMGEKLVWVLGKAEHCDTCLSLSGKVAYATEWAASGWRPQGRNLDCGGFNCQCSLEPTTRRRSPNVSDYLSEL